jgi:hypothetical protein
MRTLPTSPPAPYLYIRGLRHVAHTVFAVQDGQKVYRDPQFGILQAYSSGQQVKRSILESFTTALAAPVAPITFNWQVKTGGRGGQKVAESPRVQFEQKEAWSPCDPSYVDQLVGGYMRAEPGHPVIKRRSPLSISAMRPLHPLLGGLERERENMTFDRTDHAGHHPVRVRNEDGEELSASAVAELLANANRSLPNRVWIPDQTRATGLFVYDVCVDLRTLFCVSLNGLEPEVRPEVREALLASGWTRTVNHFGVALLAPAALRAQLIPALATALLDWRITTNQSRTFSLMETLAVAVSDSANEVAGAIRGQLRGDTERPSARPVLDAEAGAALFIGLPAEGYIAGVTGQAQALRRAQEAIVKRLQAFDYEHQLPVA